MGALDSLYGNALQNSYFQSGTIVGNQAAYSNTIWTTAAATTTTDVNVWYDALTNQCVTTKAPRRKASSLPPNQAWLDERVNEMRVAL